MTGNPPSHPIPSKSLRIPFRAFHSDLCPLRQILCLLDHTVMTQLIKYISCRVGDDHITGDRSPFQLLFNQCKEFRHTGLIFLCGETAVPENREPIVRNMRNHLMRVYSRKFLSKPYISRIDMSFDSAMLWIFIIYASCTIRSRIASANGLESPPS